MDSKHGFVLKMRELVSTLPRCVFLVLRYLFAFLYHLSEFSDENMMDVSNLAVCFGPSLIPIPDEGAIFRFFIDNPEWDVAVCFIVATNLS